MRNYFNYFTEIEEHFQKRRGSLLLLSTLDWVLIDTWREAGLPLEVVLRGIDTAFDKHQQRQHRAASTGKRLRPVNGLAWCAQAVLESAEQAAKASFADPAQASTSPGAETDTGFEPDRVAAFLQHNAAALASLHLAPPASDLLAETTSRLRSLATARSEPQAISLEDLDRTLSTLEERLVAALLTLTSEPELTAIRAEADAQLAPFRSRMGAVQIRQLQQQFLHKRLLEQHRIPRLSLFYMSLQ